MFADYSYLCKFNTVKDFECVAEGKAWFATLKNKNSTNIDMGIYSLGLNNDCAAFDRFRILSVV